MDEDLGQVITERNRLKRDLKVLNEKYQKNVLMNEGAMHRIRNMRANLKHQSLIIAELRNKNIAFNNLRVPMDHNVSDAQIRYNAGWNNALDAVQKEIERLNALDIQ